MIIFINLFNLITPVCYRLKGVPPSIWTLALMTGKSCCSKSSVLSQIYYSYSFSTLLSNNETFDFISNQTDVACY